jgi:hypothetical protein
MSASESASDHLICAHPGCKSSGKVFKRSYELERHKLIHFPSKKLTCPVQDCKHKKKGKTFTRDDKFREHIGTHGELAIFSCPVPNCKIGQVKNGDFASHIANDHNILERYGLESFLRILRISCDKGRWACPLLCDFSASSKYDVVKHLATHDLIERLEFKSSIYLLGLGYAIYRGKASCPVCNMQLCNEHGYISYLCRHLETSHDADEMIPKGDKIAWLLGHMQRHPYSYQWPTLMRVIRDFKPAHVELSTIPLPIFGLSAGENSSRFSTPPMNLENVLLDSNVDRDGDVENSSSRYFGELPVEQVWNPHWTTPLQSSIPPETDVTGHTLPTGELPIYGQNMMAQQNLNPPQTFPQAHGLFPQQNFPEPHSFIQPQGSMMPQTVMSAGVSQNAPAVSTFITPIMFQGMTFWQPIQPNASSLGYNQYYPHGPNQWPSLPNMNGYGIENHQQGPSLFVPFPDSQPDEMGFCHPPEFDWSASEAAQ